LEVNQKVALACSAASEWLGVRLQMIGVTLLTGVALIAVIQHQFSSADPGTVYQNMLQPYCAAYKPHPRISRTRFLRRKKRGKINPRV